MESSLGGDYPLFACSYLCQLDRCFDRFGAAVAEKRVSKVAWCNLR